MRLLPIVWMVRTATPPLMAAPSIEKALQRASGLPVTRIRSMDQIVAESTARSRFDMWLMTLFGGCALLLAAIGVYGLMAYSVQQRTAEIGIRMALGADRNSVRNMVLRQGMDLAISGIIVGAVVVALVRPSAVGISVRGGSTRSGSLHDGHTAACGRGVHCRMASRAACHTTGSGYGTSPGVSEWRAAPHPSDRARQPDADERDRPQSYDVRRDHAAIPIAIMSRIVTPRDTHESNADARTW